MCIYLGDSDELKYDSREHVFPACLGGKTTLENGVVSDDANALFSPLEKTLVQESTIALCRAMEGPGKRGSLASKKATKSKVCVSSTKNGHFFLSYLSLGKAYSIPQILIKDIHDMENKEIAGEAPSVLEMEEFIENAYCLLSNYTFIQDERLENSCIIGSRDGKCYIAAKVKPESNEVNIWAQKFLKASILKWGKNICHVEQGMPLKEDSDSARMYAKVGMNVLAYTKGSEFVKNTCFDKIRNWIMYGENEEEFFCLPIESAVKDMLGGVPIPPNSHWCIFHNCGDEIIGEICFYNSFLRRFKFGKMDSSLFGIEPCFFICDWKNQLEIDWHKYIYALKSCVKEE